MNVTSTLVVSLNQDIHILNQLLRNISGTYDSGLIKSWIFPSKRHDFVSEIISSKSFTEASYERCLEITLDRLYVLINLFYIKTQDLKPVATNVSIAEPGKVTLGFCTKLLWENIVRLMEKETTKETTSLSGNQNAFDNKQCQTEIFTLNTCDSCCSAIICMKRLFNLFDNHQDRIQIDYEIFDITQFGCMLKVTSSIEDALNNLYTKFQQEKAEKETLKEENKCYKAKFDENEKKIAFLEEEVAILSRQHEKDTQIILTLRQEQNKLTEENASRNYAIDILTETVNNLRNCIESICKENNNVKNENRVLKTNVEKSIELLSKCNAKINNKLLKLDEEYSIIKYIIEQYEKSIMNLNTKLGKITKNIGKTELKVKSNFEDTNKIMQDFFNCRTHCEKLKDMFKEKIDKLRHPPEPIPIKGNPIEDISKQIEENKTKIQNLEDENIKLHKLLTRFKNMKIMK